MKYIHWHIFDPQHHLKVDVSLVDDDLARARARALSAIEASELLSEAQKEMVVKEINAVSPGVTVYSDSVTIDVDSEAFYP